MAVLLHNVAVSLHNVEKDTSSIECTIQTIDCITATSSSISTLVFCQYHPKYWQHEYKKIFKSPKFKGGSASVIENEKHLMVNEKSPKNHI